LKRTGILNVVKRGVHQGVQSVFFFEGFPPLGSNGGITRLSKEPLTNSDILELLQGTTTEMQLQRFTQDNELDYTYEMGGFGRFRMCAFVRRGSLGIVVRPVSDALPSFDDLGLPDSLKEFAQYRNGLILVTGPSASGKSTTVAALVELINRERLCHIVTVEDPIEFIFTPKRSIFSQREIGRDTKSFLGALKRIVREDADVIFVGEIRERESMKAALEIAETGALVFSTLHTLNVAQTINRIIDFFPDHEKNTARAQVANVLKAVVSQRLLMRADSACCVCACEVMKVNPAIKSLIREDKIHQIVTILDTAKSEGMTSLDESLRMLSKQGVIDVAQAIAHSSRSSKFIEDIAEVKPTKDGISTTKGIMALEKDLAVYQADLSVTNLSSFDASGRLFSTPVGFLFRDTGALKGPYHFAADYTILNGKKEPFRLKSFLNISYKILETKIEKPAYAFKVRVFEDSKNDYELTEKPLDLIKDGNWHTITIQIPQKHTNRTVKFYMLLFDGDIKEVSFDNIFFL